MASSSQQRPDLTIVKLEDRAHLTSFHNTGSISSCEYNFVNLFCWQTVYRYKWFVHDGRLVVHDGLDDILFMPLGRQMDPLQLQRLSSEAVTMGLSGDICLVPGEYLNTFPQIETYYEVVQDRDAAEYIYLAERLAELKGTKLHKKRNLISQFKRNNPDFKTAAVGPDNLLKTRAFARDMIEITDPVPKSLSDEFMAMEKAFGNWEALNLEGIVVTVQDKVAAFSIFSAMGKDTYNVHFEKSNLAFKGAAQMINRETARYLSPRTRYINREQDLGIKGLRQAKLSYDPHILWVPCRLKFNGANNS